MKEFAAALVLVAGCDYALHIEELKYKDARATNVDGTGDGSPTLSCITPRLDTPTTGPALLGLGDLDGNGKLDAVIGTSSKSIVMLEGTGDGRFVGLDSLTENIVPDSLRVADFDHDGSMDLAFIVGSNVVMVLDPVGNTVQQTFAIPSASTLAVGRFDVTADNDIAVMNMAGGQVLMPFGNAYQVRRTIAAQGISHAAAVGDFNHDGYGDLVASDPATSATQVQVLLNTGQSFTPVSITTPTRPDLLAVADLNGDGTDDFIVAGITTISTFLSTGNGNFNPETIATFGFTIDAIAIADLDNDHTPEIIVTTQENGGTLRVLHPNGSEVRMAQTTGKKPIAVAVGDLDNDGLPDIVVAASDDNQLNVFLGCTN